MKIILTIIILISSIFLTVLFVKQYHASAPNKTVSVSETTTVSIPTPEKITLSESDIATTATSIAASTISLPDSTAIHTASIAVSKPATIKQKNKKTADLNVNKLISVTSSQGLKPKALKSALNAYTWALNNGKLGNNKDILTVVDFSLPSYEKRMWVLNLHSNKVLMKLYTTQGAGSGLVYASRFSNTSMTQASSLGLYVTSDEYYGGHGKSMRLNGLQKGINSNARRRNIVIHEAPYATPEYVRANHRAGRSWGCFAVAPSSKKTLLNYVRGGSALFAYARSIEKTPIISNGPISI